MVAPSYRMWRVSIVWLGAFVVLMLPAAVADGTFETAWGGPLVLGAALTLRLSDVRGIVDFLCSLFGHSATKR